MYSEKTALRLPEKREFKQEKTALFSSVLCLLAIVLFVVNFAASEWLESDASDFWTYKAEPVWRQRKETPMETAQRILKKAPIIDTHNDWPTALNRPLLKNMDLVNTPSNEFHTDITRLRKGRVGAQFWSAYVDCAPDFHTQTNAVLNTLDNIDLIKRIVGAYPEDFEFAKTAEDIRRIAKRGKIASLVGIEGAHQIDGSLGALRLYFELGVRYMTLTHSCHTAWADSCTPTQPLYGGISNEGLRFLREMNRVGMMIDISHVSAKVMHQAINASVAPVIFSHSSAYGVTPVLRNVPDDVLELLSKRDGVVMINFLNPYVSPNGTVAGIADVVHHMQHIKKVAGAKHIGIGADFDGAPINDFALQDVSKYPDLIAELVRSGFTEQEIIGITGGNLLRVMEEVERVAKYLTAVGQSIEEYGLIVQKVC